MMAIGVEGVHASCRTSLSEEGSPLFDTAVHLVDYDKVCDLVETVQPNEE